MERYRLKLPPKQPKMRRHPEVAEKIRDIEFLKLQIAHRLEDLKQLLAEPDIAPAWAEFCAAGGVTAAELYRWAQGQEIIREGVKRKGHLRLVSGKIVRYRPRLSEGDETA